MILAILYDFECVTVYMLCELYLFACKILTGSYGILATDKIK